jgi:hypothetical protein
VRGPWLTLLVAVALGSLTGCPAAKPRSVRIVLSLHGAGGRPVHGFDVTVALPAGSRVAHDAATRRISPGALTLLAGATAATADGRFVPHATTPSIRVLLASRTPLRDGEVAAIEATVTSATAPSRGQFEVVSAAVAAPDGASVPGATGWVSAVEIR